MYTKKTRSAGGGAGGERRRQGRPLWASSSPSCLPFAGSPHRGLPAHRRHASPPRGLPAAGPSRRLRPAAGQLPRLGAEEQRSYRQARRSRGPAAWGGGAGVPSVSSEEQGPGGAGAEKLLDPDKEKRKERGRGKRMGEMLPR